MSKRVYPRVACPICKKVIRKDYLDGHQKTIHEKPNNINCSKCNFKCSTKKALNAHIVKAHTDNYKCNICNKKLSGLRTLKSHIKIMHNNGDGFKCLKCDTSYNNKISYDRHRSELHGIKRHRKRTNEGPPRKCWNYQEDFLNCKWCPYQTKHKGNYKKHIITKHNNLGY